MTPERWKRIEELFAEALERAPQERPAFLSNACPDDPQMRREIETLLACDEPDQHIIEPAAYLGFSSEVSLEGERIGPYRILRLIGQGGSGVVYLGVRDDDEYRKLVAIKVLRRGMDTDVMLERFRRERQILASLEHPFIAGLMDGGATSQGVPYFVMEYVDGVPITAYCESKKLSTFEKLRLFCLVCEAVQFAHQNLVVHRDLKPGNILTAKEGIPKLLDFGIAKVVNGGDFAGTNAPLTRNGIRMLTPNYASPEQVKGLPVNTATDIYSLGAVLYELLTGCGAHQFPSNSYADLEKTICEVEPEAPSTAAANNGRLSQKERNDLHRELSGDLDKIVLMALHKQAQRRYASVADLADDLRRHMESQPVRAQQESLIYRAGKFIRRNRMIVIAACLFISALLGGILSTAIQAKRAQQRFDLARQLSNAVVAEVKGPLSRVPGSTAVRASLIGVVVKYLDGLALDANQEPSFELEIADAYREVASIEGHPFRQNLGQADAALKHFQRAIQIYSSLVDRAEARSHAMGGLIGANIEIGDIEAIGGKPDAAKDRLYRMADLAKRTTEESPGTLGLGTLVYLYFRLGDAERRAGETNKALSYFQSALAYSTAWANAEPGANARSTLFGAHGRLASAQLDAGDLDGARKNYQAALEVAKRSLLATDATDYERSNLVLANGNLATILGNPNSLNLGEVSSAILHARTAVEVAESLATADPLDFRARDNLASALQNLAEILLQKYPEASLQLHRRHVEILRELTLAAPSNSKFRYEMAASQTSLGEALQNQGKSREALQQLTLALETASSLSATAEDPIALTATISRIHAGLGNTLLAIGADNALLHYKKALDLTKQLAEGAPSNMPRQRLYADSLENMGRYYLTAAHLRPQFKAAAREWLTKSVDVWRRWTRDNIAKAYAKSRERQLEPLFAAVEQK